MAIRRVSDRVPAAAAHSALEFRNSFLLSGIGLARHWIGARAIPDDHLVIPQLNDLFGEHTFFLDRNGLNIVEPAEAAAGAAAQSAKVVNLASWSDDDPTGLELHEPEATDIVITFESRH